MTADEILTEARAALAYHEAEAARLRMLLGLVPYAAPITIIPWTTPGPMYPLSPSWPYQAPPADHGGMCDCPCGHCPKWAR